jgi:hypothetical protein
VRGRGPLYSGAPARALVGHLAGGQAQYEGRQSDESDDRYVGALDFHVLAPARPVEGDVEAQHIHTGFAQEADATAFSVFRDEPPDRLN